MIPPTPEHPWYTQETAGESVAACMANADLINKYRQEEKDFEELLNKPIYHFRGNSWNSPRPRGRWSHAVTPNLGNAMSEPKKFVLISSADYAKKLNNQPWASTRITEAPEGYGGFTAVFEDEPGIIYHVCDKPFQQGEPMKVTEHTYIPQWVDSNEYRRGDLAVYEGAVYECMIQKIASSKTTPNSHVWVWKKRGLYGPLQGECVQHQSKEGIIKERDEAVSLLKKVCEQVNWTKAGYPEDYDGIDQAGEIPGMREWWEKHREKTKEEKRLSALKGILIEYGDAYKLGVVNPDDVAKIILSTLINDSLED